MADTLSDYDRRLIDAAIASGRITRVPTGASGIPFDFWDGKKLRSPDPLALRKSMNALYRKSTAPSPDTVTRRGKIRELHDTGLPVKEIAGSLDITTESVRKHLKALGVKPHPAKRAKAIPPPQPAVRASQAKRDEAVKLYQAGKTAAEIAGIVGVHANRVRTYLREVFGTLTWDRHAAGKKAAATKRARG